MARSKKASLAPPRTAIPLFGRSREQTLLRQQLALTPVVVVKGPAGVGKSRLVFDVAHELGVATAMVRCLPGDTAEVLVARVERLLRCGWGNAQQAIASSASLVVLDDAHQVSAEVLHQAVSELAPGATSLGRLVVTNRDGLGGAVTGQINELELAGLDAASSNQLFDALDARFGPVAVADDGNESALWTMTRGNPAAIAQQFGAARVPRSDDADLRAQLLTAAATLRLPVATPALASMVAQGDAAAVLRAIDELVAQQQLGNDVLDAVWLPTWNRSAARVVDVASHRAAVKMWQSGNHGHAALDAAREAVVHACATGDAALVAQTFAAASALRFERGSSTEIVALLQRAGTAAETPELRELALQVTLQARRIHDVRQLLQQARRRGDETPTAATIAAAVAVGAFTEAKRALALVENATTPAITALRNGLQLLIGSDVSATADDAESQGLALWRTDGPSAARGLFAAARSALRAPATQDAAQFARLSTHYALCLMQEGRVSEAAAVVAELETWALGVETVEAVDCARSSRAQYQQATGDYRNAAAGLRGLMQQQRMRGDEVAALATEIALAELEVTRGHAVSATELATVVKAAAQRLGCKAWGMRADVVMANVDLFELRADAALGRLETVDAAVVGVRGKALVDVATAKAYGFLGRHADASELSAQLAQHPQLDAIERQMACAEVAIALGNLGGARELLHAAAATAERHGRRAEMIAAFALLARVELARGDRAVARSCATRAAREASTADLAHARCIALLALGALARAEDDAASGVAYARDAAELASVAGLPVERFVAYAALDAIAGPEAVADPAAPSAATLSPMAFDLCTKILAELGLSSQRPFGLIDAEGATSEVVDASPEVLQLAKRALAIDGVRESIWRHGQELADLRRRSLLKKLLFLFASAPGNVFSKEAIVSAVWNVEYHPLRHDAALFTNIMRIRRLLGEGGAEIIRVTDDGYRFVPPADFVFVFAR